MNVLRAGLHFQSLDWDLSPVLEGPWESFTVLRDDRPVVRPLWQRKPHARFHLRMMEWITDDPISRARDAAQAANEILDACPGIDLWVSGLNEPSLEGGSGTQRGFERWRDYAILWRNEFKRLCPRAKTLYGAESPGHNEDGPTRELVGYLIMGPAMRLYDGFACHLYITQPPGESAYWHGLRAFRKPLYKDQTEGGDFGDPGGLYWITRDWRRPDGSQYPILITEVNVTAVGAPGVPGQIRAWLQDVTHEDIDRRTDGADWFIWAAGDEAFATMRLAQSQAAVDAWQDTPYEEEPPMPDVPGFRLGFAELAERLRAEGHTVTADEDEISIAGASLQQVQIDGQPNVFVWRDGLEARPGYPFP